MTTVMGRKVLMPWRHLALPPDGYIELIEVWGSDEGIVEAARMSTGKGFLGWGPKHADTCPATVSEGWCKLRDAVHPCRMPPPFKHADWIIGGACTCEVKPGDEKLLRSLWMNRHTTPFEQAGLTVEVQAPIFVYREWHRHRTQSYNEFSARYSQMPDLHYVPTLERIYDGVRKAGLNKQAQGTVTLTDDPDALAHWVARASELQRLVYEHYEEGLRLGIPKEIARINTPVARLSKMRASANLLNWLRFLGLRDAPDAQWEIRQYAQGLALFIEDNFPRTYALMKEKAL